MSSDEAEALPSVFVEHADVAVSLDEAPSLLSSAEVGSSDGAALTEHAPEAAEACYDEKLWGFNRRSWHENYGVAVPVQGNLGECCFSGSCIHAVPANFSQNST